MHDDGNVNPKVRVMVVDDAAFMRRSLVKLLKTAPDIEVVAEAVNGRQAVELFETVRPDLICLDIDMPIMDGLTALKHVMSIRPTPVVIVSSMTDRDHIPFEALRLGVIDFVPKLSAMSGELDAQIQQLLLTVRNSRQVCLDNIRRIPLQPEQAPLSAEGRECRHLLAVGGTIGTVGTLIGLLHGLRPQAAEGLSIVCRVPLPPVITDHFLGSVSSRLGWSTQALEESAPLEGGKLYLAPAHGNVSVVDGALESLRDPQPSLNSFLATAGRTFGACASLVLLAGGHDDGQEGLSAAADHGADCYAQDLATALYRDWSIDREGIDLLDLQGIMSRVQAQMTVSATLAGA